jgi:hypothetical protein
MRIKAVRVTALHIQTTAIFYSACILPGSHFRREKNALPRKLD